MERPRDQEITQDHKPETLRDMTTEELSAMLLESSDTYSPHATLLVCDAIILAEQLHHDDVHKDTPYSYHLLRVANRLQYHLGVHDPSLIISALLHDSVEDHPDMLSRSYLQRTTTQHAVIHSELLEREYAYKELAARFGPKVPETVRLVTNQPDSLLPSDYNEWLDAYYEKVAQAIETPEGWLIKFCDWTDNALDSPPATAGTTDRMLHFKTKYGRVQPLLQTRFERPDLQELLGDNAKHYVTLQFEKGETQLILS